MAKHEVLIHETRNITGDGTTLYTGSYIEKESVRQAGFVGFLSAKSGLPAVQAQAILEGSFEAVEELEKESLVRIHTDLGTICGIITGSFETADAAFDPEKNTLELAIRLEDELKLSLADVVPTIVTDESLTKLRVDGLMDLATPRPYNLIHGQKVFRVSCYNMVHEDEGATVFLQDAKGVTFPVVVDKVISKQLFEGHTAELLEPGDYKLVAKSRAGDAEGPLQTAFHRVKYLKVAAPKPTVPVITNVTSENGGAMRVKASDGKLVVEGMNLIGGGITEAKLTASNGDPRTGMTLVESESTDTRAVFTSDGYLQSVAASTDKVAGVLIVNDLGSVKKTFDVE